MKTQIFLTGLTACFLAIAFTACNKSSTEPPAAAPEATSTTANQAAAAAKTAANQATDAAKTAAAQTVAAVTNAVSAVTNAAAAATSQFDDAIAAAKKAIADKNYQSALDALNKLQNAKLSDAQQKIVDDLKAQVQQLISAGTTGAADAAKKMLGN